MTARKKVEFGDFQTPSDLARDIANFLRSSCGTYDTIVEPTCGRGSFVAAAIGAFPGANNIYGFDINPQHVKDALAAARHYNGQKLHLVSRDFFQIDWVQFFSMLGGTILVIGNPPWVTNSTLGALGSDNLPEKSNFQGHKGFAAKTGKANFDISEWMLIKLLEALHRRNGCIALLCKTATARKTLRHAWLSRLNIGRCSLHLIDAQKHFGASVEACLLVVHTNLLETGATACVYPDFSFNNRIATIGLAGKELVADIDEYHRLRDIDGISYYTWRSGVKHDAAAIMEFRRNNGYYVNGLNEKCQLEGTCLFPLLKSSDIANGRLMPEKYALVTQRKPSDDTADIKKRAPKTWTYLTAHAEALNQRRSIIYQKRPSFSVFGVGEYTFSPWKVAISALYKNCRFVVLGKHNGQPIVLDDTCYFVPCASEDEAEFVCELLNSDICQRFLKSLVFFNAKRPITIDILSRIDLKRVAEYMNRAAQAQIFLSAAAAFEDKQPLLVFEKKGEYLTKKNRRPDKSRS